MASKPYRILVVDDDVPIRQLLVDVLSESGWTVLEAIHGAQAFKIVTDTPVDLIISDVMMPQMDGVTLCKRVKAIGATAVILMSSAPLSTSFDAGQDAFIAKPFDLNVVEELVASILSARTNREPLSHRNPE